MQFIVYLLPFYSTGVLVDRCLVLYQFSSWIVRLTVQVELVGLFERGKCSFLLTGEVVRAPFSKFIFLSGKDYLPTHL